MTQESKLKHYRIIYERYDPEITKCLATNKNEEEVEMYLGKYREEVSIEHKGFSQLEAVTGKYGTFNRTGIIAWNFWHTAMTNEQPFFQRKTIFAKIYFEEE
jgi:hypothetical protein